MISLAWILNSYADSLVLLYAAAILGGIGAGSVTAPRGNALKWFPDRAALAAAPPRRASAPVPHHRGAEKHDRAKRLPARLLSPRIGQGTCPSWRSSCASRHGRMPAKKKQLQLPQTNITSRRAVLRSPIFW